MVTARATRTNRDPNRGKILARSNQQPKTSETYRRHDTMSLGMNYSFYCTAVSGVLPAFQCVNYKLQRAMERVERSGIGVSRGREGCLFAGGGGRLSRCLFGVLPVFQCVNYKLQRAMERV